MRFPGQTAGLFPLATVLVVDANPDTRELYSLMLADAAKVVEVVEDGRIALAKALAHPPDLVVTDTPVPYIDGCALCRQLRGDPLTARVPIIVATDDGRVVNSIRAAGANAVLMKPFPVSVFIETIRNVLVQPDFGGGSDRPSVGTAPASAGLRRTSMKNRAYERHVTTTPPRVPPPLRCPRCDRLLAYDRSRVGGVSAASPEQWDLFGCPGTCGSFEYRHRTKRLKSVSRPT